jgi:oligosaccharide translocation protein RFT1
MSILSASAQGASLLIVFQIISRGFTFIVNQVLLRFLSPEVLGLSAQLDLYSITVLSFARESIRVACQRQRSSIQTVVNFGFLPVFIGAPLAYGLAVLYQRAELPDVPYFVPSLFIYGVSAVIELLSEPSFIVSQQLLLYRLRASTEAIATFGRCLATCGTAIYAARIGKEIGVLPFALGQLAYSVLLLISYTGQIYFQDTKESFSLLPRTIETSKPGQYTLGLFPRELGILSISLFIQNSFKYVLTQGDGMLIAVLASLKEQGAYALASNYGGLIARMVFQPIEEASRNMFAQLFNLADEANSDPVKAKKQKDDLENAKTLLQRMLRLYCIIGLVACAVGPTVAPILLRLIAGRRWSDTDASIVLSNYCYYIPLLALNGVSEAFVAATASTSTLNLQSALMGVWFVAFAASTYLFMEVMRLGASGLVFANCINMGSRIAFNTYFIRSYFGSRASVYLIPFHYCLC